LKTETDKYPLVYVEWEDSQAGVSGWGLTDGARPSLVTVRSVGWLVYDGEDCKLIVPHLSAESHNGVKQQGCGDMTIPASSVRKVVKLAFSLKRIRR
jgi:hypothetical protein